jgi:hypothetical protein
MGYSAARFDTDVATFARFSNASWTRPSKPGLSGANGVSISFEMPNLAAAAKIVLRRDRNCAASTGLAKSDTSTDHLVSYSVHSGDISSGVPNAGSRFFGMECPLSSVRLPQRYDSSRNSSQNKDHDIEARTDETAHYETRASPMLCLARLAASFSSSHSRSICPHLISLLPVMGRSHESAHSHMHRTFSDSHAHFF